MAAERFAGGRGIAFDTQTAVKANPKKPSLLLALPMKQRNDGTCISRGHEEHRDIPPGGRHSRHSDYVAYDHTPPWHT